MSYCIIVTTCSGKKVADQLAQSLVQEKLAACVQLSQISSIYSWQGKLCKDPEIRLVIKTRTALYDKVEDHIKALHEYQIPQILKVPVSDGLDEYLNWIDENTEQTG